MANLYPVQSPASMNWSASTWATTDGGAADQAPPGSMDTAVFTSNTGDVTLTANASAINVLLMTGYTGTLDVVSYSLNVDGQATFDGTIAGTTGEVQVLTNVILTAAMTWDTDVGLVLDGTGTRSVTTNSVPLGAITVEIASASTITQQDAITCNSFSQTTSASNWNGNSKAMTVTGAAPHIIISAGSTTGMLVTQDGSGNLQVAGGGSAIDSLTCAVGAADTCTATDTIWLHRITLGKGTFNKNSRTLIVLAGGGSDDFFAQDADNTFTSTGGRVEFEYLDDLSNGAITIPSELRILMNHSNTLTMTGDIDLTASALVVRSQRTGYKGTLDLNGNDLTCGAITLGDSGNADREGTLLLDSGSHTIASIARANASDAENAVNFGSSIITLTGTINGTGLVFTNTSGKVYGGTVQAINASATAFLQAWRSADGGSNQNVKFMSRIMHHQQHRLRRAG